MNNEATSDTVRRIRRMLLVLTLGVYALSVLTNDFVMFDDDDYVVSNPHVMSGLSLANIGWSFGFHSANWHPLAWISHMLDCSLFGLDFPAGHHFTSLVLHCASTLLLFGLLRRLTGTVWRSALVAAWFAWHPLHVESVAWVAERKDVLCAFFGILSLRAYARFAATSKAQNPFQNRQYWAALMLFALGLMSKPMLVTLPCVLLLLDFWPLRRIADFGMSLPRQAGSSPVALPPVPLLRLVLEKIPFFALTLGASVLTFLAQRASGAVASIHQDPFTQRCLNSVLAYFGYLEKMLVPTNLAIFYPVQPGIPVPRLMLALLALVGISLLCLGNLRRRPYLLFGWLWFLGMLVPTIGLVQVGAQLMADRYTYLPSIGIFLMVAWGLGELVEVRPTLAKAVKGAVGVSLGCCLLLTWRQSHYWWSTLTLFRHAEAVIPPNVVVESILGQAYLTLKRLPEAREHLESGARLSPKHPAIMIGFGGLALAEGRTNEAIVFYEQALQDKPFAAQSHVNLGDLLSSLNRWPEATHHYTLAVQFDPSLAVAQFGLGRALLKQGNREQAKVHLQAAVRLWPNYAEATALLQELQKNP